MRPALALILASVMASCTAHGPPENRLAGSQWRFVEIDSVAPVAPARAGLQFLEKELKASVGCNSIDGVWRIEQDRLIAGPMQGSRKYCAQQLYRQEQSVEALLVAAPVIEQASNRLILRSRGHVAVLEQVSPPQSGP